MPSFAVLVQSLFRKRSKKRANKNKLQRDMASVTASSAASSSPSTSNTSGSQHRYDSGRRYQNVENVAYVLPNDEEEIDRIHQQHWLFKIIFNGNFIAPIEDELQKGIRVIDIGCGPGTWTLEMAEAYPHSSFVGTDISAVFPESIKPKNCHFEIANIGAHLPYPDDQFDYLHQRILTLGLTAAEWDNAFKEHMRVVKPGGWIELTEFDLDIENVGPKMKLIVDAFMSACALKGLCPKICHDLDRHLEAVGGNIVDAKIFRVPLNHSGKVGDMFWEDFIQGFMGLRPFIAKAHPEFEQEEVYRQYLVDCGEENRQNQANVRMYRVVCQKPPQA